MRRAVAVVVASSLLALGGCATSAIEGAPARPDEPWIPPRMPEGKIAAERGGPTADTRGTADASGTAGVSDHAVDSQGFVLPPDPALSSIAPTSVPESAQPYTLAQLIDLAESSNPTTRMAWDDARRAALAAGIARSTYLPTITASAIGGYQGSNGHDAATGVVPLGGGSASGSVSVLSLQWLLFDFGQRDALNEAAKQASVISNVAFTAAHQELICTVAQAFYAYAAARARSSTATESLENARSVQSAAEDRYRHGVGTVIEEAQARQHTAQAQLAQVQATGGLEDAYVALMTAMGVSPLTKIKIADISGRPLPPSVPAPVEALVSDALARRPDVQGAYAAAQASLANIRAAKAEFMPKFFISANGTHTSGSLAVTAIPAVGQQSSTVNINGSRFGGSVFAGITVPLYDGGTRAAMLAQARAADDSAAARLVRVKEEAVRQIVLADNGLRTSLSAYGAAQSLAAAAQTTFDAALGAYRSGVGSLTDVTLADSQLLQARNVVSDTYSAALSAAAALALASGTLGAAPAYEGSD